jgi:hypothetical protein
VKRVTPTEADIVRFRQDTPVKLHPRMLETMERMLEKELGYKAAVRLLGGLVAFGEIEFHKTDGHREVPSLIRSKKTQAA